MKLVKCLLIGASVVSFSTMTFALTTKPKPIHVPPNPIKAKLESPYAIVSPGARLYEGEENKNEFYILGKNDPEPVKPKKQIADNATKVEVNKVHVYKVEVNKLAVNKSKTNKTFVDKTNKQNKQDARINTKQNTARNTPVIVNPDTQQKNGG